MRKAALFTILISSLVASNAFGDSLIDELNVFLKDNEEVAASGSDSVTVKVLSQDTGMEMIFTFSRKGAWVCMEQLFTKGKIEELKRLCEAYQAESPNDGYPHYMLGRIAEVAGDAQAALDSHSKAVELTPNLLGSQFRIYAIYAIDLKDEAEAARSKVRFDESLVKIGAMAPVLKQALIFEVIQDGSYLMKEKKNFDGAIRQYGKALLVEILLLLHEV
jgi:hypothetical protein